jgi:MinD-like ATPase involved in chromosome partitioning or flagellar assembly
MYVVTFYSYQGGAGKTTALVNVAADLALRGRKVLVVDFDLAKPALSSFGPLRSDAARPGLVEFIAEYLHLNRAPALEEYVYQAKIVGDAGSHVWVMPAGRTDDNYWDALARLDWQDLYEVRDGFLLLEDLKSQWREVLQVDYVLIDSASGITDTTGICTRQLADDVVFLLVPDGSDLSDAERIMREVFEELIAAIADGRRRIDIHIVKSKVPDMDEDEQIDPSQFYSIQTPDWTVSEDSGVCIEFDLTTELPYAPVLLRGQQTVMSQRRTSRLAQGYRQLANDIILGNCIQDHEGAKAFLKKLQENPDLVVGEKEYGEPVDQWLDCTRRLEQIIEHFTAKRDAAVLGQAASCHFLARNRVRAVEILNTALEQSPTDSVLLWQRASYRLQEGDRGFVEDLMTLLGPLPDPTSASPQSRTEAKGNLPQLDTGAQGRQRLRQRLEERRLRLPVGRRLPELDTWPLRHDELPLETVTGLDSYVVSAVRLIQKRMPERLEEALQRSRVRNLSETDRDRLLSEEAPERYPDRDPVWLIRGKRFREVISRLGPSVRGASEPDFADAFHLAMAYWAVEEEAEATRISQVALKEWSAEELPRLFDKLDITAGILEMHQVLTLLAFRADYFTAAKELALSLVNDLIINTHQFQGTDFFSYWRYQSVSFSQFRDDCRDLQHMIQQRLAGVAISPPPFLSKSLRGV